LLFSANLFAQIKYASSDPKYIYAVQQADTAAAHNDYQRAFALLEQALAITDKSQRTLIKHAEAAVQLANYDAAFASLQKAQTKNWKNLCSYLLDQTDLYKAIHNDSRWKSLMEQCKKQEELFTQNLDRPLIDTLSAMRDRDDAYRGLYNQIIQEQGPFSSTLKEAKATQSRYDSANLKQLNQIIAQKGFPTISKVNLYGVQTALIIAQRGSISFRKSLLPQLEKLAEKEEIRKPDLAFFIDNLLYDEGKKQEYGTRIDMKSGNPALYPSNNPEKLNERRATMNLGTINSYLDKLGLTYLYAPKKKVKAIKPKAIKTKKVSVKKPVTTTTEKPRHLIIN